MYKPPLSKRSYLVLVFFLSLFLSFLSSLIFFSRTSSVRAQVNTYYVATNGNDYDTGSQSRPWRTIGKANQTLRAGDTVYIRGGTYNEVIEPSRSGTSGSYITYKGYAGEEAIIRGNSNQGYLAKLSGQSYIIVDSLTFIHGFRQTSYRGGWISIESGNSRHNIIRNCKITTSEADQASSWDQKDRYNDKGIVIAYSQDTLIENNYVSGMEQGIHPKRHPTRTTIKNNTVTKTWQSAIVVGSPGTPQIQSILIEGNILEKSIIEDGIQFMQNFDLTAEQQLSDISNLGTVIRNNIIRYNAENAVDFKGAGDIVVEGNIIYGTEGDNDGPFECGWDCVTGGNDRGSFRTIMRGSYTSSRDVIIRNNVLYDNAPGIVLLNDGYRVYGNTLIGNNRDFTGPNSNWAGTDTRGFKAIGSTGAQNSVVKNNIMVAHEHQEIALRVGSMGGLDINNNLYWNLKGEQFGEIVDRNTNVMSFSAWKNKLQAHSGISGNDSQSIFSKPNFINIPTTLRPVGDHSNFDFRITADSPGIDRGGALTYTAGSGSGTSIVVKEAGYFFDGYGIVDGDDIVVGSNNPVRITSINYGSNTLKVDRSISWNNNDPVNLPYSGSAPDIGAYEYGGSSPSPYPTIISTPQPTQVPTSGPSVTSVPPGPSGNILSNPSFEEGSSPWRMYNVGGNVSYSVVTPGTHGSSSAKLDIVDPGTQLQFYQSGLTLEPNTQYTLSFDAYSSSGHDLSVYVHEHDGDFTNYGLSNYLADLTTNWQTFTTEFTTTRFDTNVSDARLRLWFGPFDEAGDEYFVDNVILTKAQETPSIPGDANGDGKVDGVDYVIWFTNFGKDTQNGVQDGDFNQDRKVDGVDYVIWLTNISI